MRDIVDHRRTLGWGYAGRVMGWLRRRGDAGGEQTRKGERKWAKVSTVHPRNSSLAARNAAKRPTRSGVACSCLVHQAITSGLSTRRKGLAASSSESAIGTL